MTNKRLGKHFAMMLAALLAALAVMTAIEPAMLRAEALPGADAAPGIEESGLGSTKAEAPGLEASAEAVSPVVMAPPVLESSAYILYEPDRDKILFSKDAEQRIFPASMTKILTAIIAEEYIAPDEIIIVGNEILNIPAGSSLANHRVGEALSGENLMRGLIIPSGNETACIAAMHVARKVSGDANISYREAEKLFCNLMNEKAKEFGAKDTNFTNPHGYHAATHYTTAYDLALITREAMKSELIMRIAKETEYIGPSVVTSETGLKITNHNWPTHNLLIQAGADGYPYATGLKTGFTDEAGECLAATAERDGARLIAILCNVPKDMRWSDAKNLFEYGFLQFADRVLQEDGQRMGAIEVFEPRLGDEVLLEYFAEGGFSVFLNEEQFANVVCEMEIDKARLAPKPTEEDAEDDMPQIMAPVAKGEVIGTVAYSLKGEILFTGSLIAGRDVVERTFNTDIDFYLGTVSSNLFSVKAIPYWIGGVVLIALIVVGITMLVRRQSWRRSSRGARYHFKNRRR